MSTSHPVATRSRTLAILTALVTAVGALVLAMSWQASASANPAYPPSNSCSFSSADGSGFTPGEQVQLLGSGFGPNEQVQLSIHSQSAVLGTVTTDADGGFRATVTIPADLGPGSHILTANSPSTSCSFDPTIATSGQGGHQVGVVSANNPTSGSGLASTGFQTATAITLGVVILGGGVLLLMLGRRRRKA